MASKHAPESCPPNGAARVGPGLCCPLSRTFNLLVLSNLKILTLPNFMAVSLDHKVSWKFYN